MIGEGAWSRCFGYHVEDQEYAIRFGRYIEDFQKDRWAARFSSAQLPIPEVFEVGKGWVATSLSLEEPMVFLLRMWSLRFGKE